MAQVLDNTPYSALQSMLAGFRIAISEPASSTLKTGFRFLGTVFAPKFDLGIEYYSHYETASGAKVEDRKIPKTVAIKIGFSQDDMFAKNWERFLLGADLTSVAADPAATHVAEEFIGGVTGDLHGIDEGRQSDAQLAALAVYNVTDSALLVLNTDYSLIRQHGLSFVKMLVDTHATDTIRVGTGATAATDYTYLKLAHHLILPVTRYEREVRALLMAPSKTGGAWEWKIEKATLGPDGELDLNAEQASSVKMALNLKDDSTANPTKPWGILRHVGYDDAGASLI